MPDTYCISLMFIGLYYGLKYLETSKLYQILLFVIVSSFAILSKIPAVIYFVLMIPFLINNNYKLKYRFILTMSTLIPILLTYLWYFVWNPQLSSEFGNWYNIGKPFIT